MSANVMHVFENISIITFSVNVRIVCTYVQDKHKTTNTFCALLCFLVVSFGSKSLMSYIVSVLVTAPSGVCLRSSEATRRIWVNHTDRLRYHDITTTKPNCVYLACDMVYIFSCAFKVVSKSVSVTLNWVDIFYLLNLVLNFRFMADLIYYAYLESIINLDKYYYAHNTIRFIYAL